jgi:hypothetical protein
MAQGHQTRRIIGADRSKVNGGPIAQDDDLVDIARESLDSNGLSRPPRNLSLDAHGARPSNRSVKVVDGLEWRRFIDMLSCRLRRQVGVVWVQPYDGSATNVYAYKYLVAILPANPVGQLDRPSHRQEAPTQVSRARDHGRTHPGRQAAPAPTRPRHLSHPPVHGNAAGIRGDTAPATPRPRMGSPATSASRVTRPERLAAPCQVWRCRSRRPDSCTAPRALLRSFDRLKN